MAATLPKSVFAKQKQACLTGVDLSRKGSIDEAIFDLVNHINLQENFVTTSSCSGRIAVFSYPSSVEVKKKGCQWLHINHDYCTSQKVIESLKKCSGDAFFKFEAFVLHVQCSDLQHAQKLLAMAVASGFRNSGISVSNKGKILVGVRSTHSLEVPLTHCGKLLVTDQYIEYLVDLGNVKMKENFERIDRFFKNLKQMTFTETGPRKKLSGAAKRKKKADKLLTSDNSLEETTPAEKHKESQDHTTFEGVCELFSVQDKNTPKQGPFESGLVSLNSVSSLQFNPVNREAQDRCDTMDSEGSNNETIETASSSQIDSRSNAMRTDSSNVSMESHMLDPKTDSQQAKNDTGMDTRFSGVNEMTGSQPRALLGKQVDSVYEGNGEKQFTNANILRKDLNSSSSNPSQCSDSTTSSTVTRCSENRKTQAQTACSEEKSKPLKGITGVTILPPGEAIGSQATVTKSIEELLEKALHVDSH